MSHWPARLSRLAGRSVAPAPGSGSLSRQARTIALIVASGLFMEQLDSTVLTTALPSMARSFHVDPARMSVALTSYLVSLAVLIPASGRMSDRFGSRTVFTLAIGLFTFGSILCGGAHSLWYLVLARLLQGAGGAMMMPVGRLVLMRSVEKSQLVSAMLWMLLPATIGPLLGPPIGGFLTTYLSWRWIFTINIPVGVLGVFLSLRFIPQMRETVRQPFDAIGMILSGCALACLVFGLELAARGAGNLTGTALVLGTGLLSGCLYLLHARRIASPILDLTLLRIPTFRLSLQSGSATRIAVGATPFLVPSMLQLGFGLTAAASGAITFTSTIGAFLMRLLAKRILRAYGYRAVMSVNGISALLLTLACALFRPGWPFWLLSLILMGGGFTQALQFTSLNTIAYADVPDHRMSAATSFYATAQQMTLTLGISVAAACLSATRAIWHHDTPQLADFSAAFLVVGLFSMLAIPSALAMPPDAGSVISGHRPKAGSE